MKIIGLTGGIGSGKSTVAQVFAFLGIPTYSSDDRAKEMYNKSEIKQLVCELFGKAAYQDGQLNRAYLASQVFTDSAKLQQLNQIIHPAVQSDFEQWKSEQQAPYILKEAAILFESRSYLQCDYVILVTAPAKVRIERVMQRDQTTQEEVEARMSKQWPDDRKIPLSDYVIQNDGEQSIIRQVLDIHHKIVGAD